MPDTIANPNIAPEEYPRFWFRLLEMVPGAAVWFVLITPIVFARIAPDYVTVFVLIFDFYWLIKALSYGGILIRGYASLRKTLSIDWQHRVQELTPEQAHGRDWQDIYHAIILTTFKEEKEILQSSIDSILAAHYDPKHLFVVIATEERGGAHAAEVGEYLKQKYHGQFGALLVTKHPDNIVGEVKAKGANATWAAKQLVTGMREQGIQPEQVVVTTADADTRLHPLYFWRLTYLYLTIEDHLHCAFQPIAMYFNNIWDAPTLSRVLAFGDTFWIMVESMRPYRMITFSTHAMSLQTLIDIDFWCTSIVNEDSRQYYRAYFRYAGHFQSIPMFLPVYMDAVLAGTLKNSLKNLYLQKQRWAYGTEHFPYIVLESIRQRHIPLLDRLALVYRAFEGNFSWATQSYFITVVGWLPFLLTPQFQQHLVAYNFQLITRNILLITWIGLFISAYVTVRILPDRPAERTKLNSMMMVLQWLIVPISAIFFSSIPAIDAQTRLMLGRYIGFRVTEKAST